MLEELAELENLVEDLAQVGEWAIREGLLTEQELSEIAGLEGLDEIDAAEEILEGFIEFLGSDDGLEDLEALEWGFFKGILRKARRIARNVGRGIRRIIRKARKIKIKPSTLKKAAIGAAIIGGALALPAIAPAVVSGAGAISSKVIGRGLFGKIASWAGQRIASMWKGGKSAVRRGWNLLRRRILTPQPQQTQQDPQQSVYGPYFQYSPSPQKNINWPLILVAALLGYMVIKGGRK